MNLNSLTDKPIIANTTSALNRAHERAAGPALGAAAAPAEQQPSVEVRLSAVTQTMTQNVARSGTDVFNTEKVNAMRSAIQNGSFSVNAEVIADRLIANAREMLGVAGATTRNEQAPTAPR